MADAADPGPWAALVLGHLIGAQILGGARGAGEVHPATAERPVPGLYPEWVALEPRPRPAAADLASLSPRELRAVPGIGERRAAALFRARWEHGRSAAPFDSSATEGIGPATARALADWLAENAVPVRDAAPPDRTLGREPP